MSVWCVVNTRPNQELRAEANLRRQGYKTWLPTLIRSRRHARRIDTVRTPAFPGYLFVELDLDRHVWSPINGTFGVRRLLTIGQRPQVLPREFVLALRDAVGGDGECSFVPADLAPGASVRILSGPFVDCVAEIASYAPGDRVKLLLNVLGGEIAAIIPRTAISAAS